MKTNARSIMVISMKTNACVRLGLVAAIAAASLLASAGTASAERRRVGVPKFEGPQEAAIRGRVTKALREQGYEVVRPADIDAAVESSGVSLETDTGFKKLARELSIAAFVTGEISGKKARLAVRSGSDGAVSGEAAFTAPNPKKLAAEVGKGFWRRLGSAVERGKLPAGAKAPPKPSAEPEEKEEVAEGGDDDSGGKAAGEPVASREKESADEEERPARRRARAKAKPKAESENGEAEGEVSATAEEPGEGGGGGELTKIDAAVGMTAFTRSLSYNQDVTNALRAYKLGLGPALAFNATIYPLAFAMRGPAANLGVVIDVEQAFAVTSQIGVVAGTFPNGATFPTTIHEYAGGVRYRIPIGDHQFSASLTGGEHAFAFRSGSGDAVRGNLDIPDTIYRYVRPGIDARITVLPTLAILASTGYRYVFNSGGQIHDTYFPHLTVGAVDGTLGVAYKITPFIEARVLGQIRRYFYSMHSTMADLAANPMAPIAGGAVDQYLSGTGMLAVLY